MFMLYLLYGFNGRILGYFP